jgi:N-formylglutamate deformylase
MKPYSIYLPESGPLAGTTELVATAIHQGQYIEDHVLKYFSLNQEGRLREEDPYTDEFTDAGSVRVIVNYSRFRVDLNRPRDIAVYLRPQDAWNLDIYHTSPPKEIINEALIYYDTFYSEMHELLSSLVKKWGKVFVYDFHSYNHRRDGINAPYAPEVENPEINIGTGNIDREYWGKLIDRFMDDLRTFNFGGKKLDVRENIKFKGGYFSKWIGENFPDTVCVLAIEVKKFFMDEWTGEKDNTQIHLLKQAFISTRAGILRELKKTGIAA